MVWRDSGWRAQGKKAGTISFWKPVPPDGYVPIGHVASASHAPPPLDTCACLRADLATIVPREAFERGPAWTPSGAGFKLGRKPLAIFRAANAIDLLSSSPPPDGRSLGTLCADPFDRDYPVSYTHLRAHET